MGQILTSTEGDAAGLEIRVTATQTAIAAVSGDFGTVSYSRGLIAGIEAEVDQLTRSSDGVLAAAREAIETTLEQVDDDIFRLEDRLTARERQLILTFSRAEQAVQALQSQQTAFQSGAGL